MHPPDPLRAKVPARGRAWWVYFATGFALAIYVFFVFIRSLRTLFSHEMHAAADEESEP